MIPLLKFVTYSLIYNLVLNWMEPTDQRVKSKMAWFNFSMFAVFALLFMIGCASTPSNCKTKVVGNDHPVRFEQECK